ncbi:hypothetical protein JCM10213_006397 [Rhodosporidiobolus nylandii]
MHRTSHHPPQPLHPRSPRSSRTLVPPTPAADTGASAPRTRGDPFATAGAGSGRLARRFKAVRREVPSFAGGGVAAQGTGGGGGAGARSAPQGDGMDEQEGWESSSGGSGSSDEDSSEVDTDDEQVGVGGAFGGFAGQYGDPDSPLVARSAAWLRSFKRSPMATYPAEDYAAFEQTYEHALGRAKDLFEWLSEDVVQALLPQLTALKTRLSESASILDREKDKLLGQEAQQRQARSAALLGRLAELTTSAGTCRTSAAADLASIREQTQQRLANLRQKYEHDCADVKEQLAKAQGGGGGSGGTGRKEAAAPARRR